MTNVALPEPTTHSDLLIPTNRRPSGTKFRPRLLLSTCEFVSGPPIRTPRSYQSLIRIRTEHHYSGRSRYNNVPHPNGPRDKLTSDNTYPLRNLPLGELRHFCRILCNTSQVSSPCGQSRVLVLCPREMRGLTRVSVRFASLLVLLSESCSWNHLCSAIFTLPAYFPNWEERFPKACPWDWRTNDWIDIFEKEHTALRTCIWCTGDEHSRSSSTEDDLATTRKRGGLTTERGQAGRSRQLIGRTDAEIPQATQIRYARLGN